MQDPASSFRQRAGACFRRRRKHPVLSAGWRHEVEDARMFIRAYHTSNANDPHECLIDPFDNPQGFIRAIQEAGAAAAKEAVEENDRLEIPTAAGEDGRVVYYLYGKRVPPPEP